MDAVISRNEVTKQSQLVNKSGKKHDINFM